jgi:hypothetical protein
MKGFFTCTIRVVYRVIYIRPAPRPCSGYNERSLSSFHLHKLRRYLISFSGEAKQSAQHPHRTEPEPVLEYEFGVRAAGLWLNMFICACLGDAGKSPHMNIYPVVPCPFEHSTVLVVYKCSLSGGIMERLRHRFYQPVPEHDGMFIHHLWFSPHVLYDYKISPCLYSTDSLPRSLASKLAFPRRFSISQNLNYDHQISALMPHLRSVSMRYSC